MLLEFLLKGIQLFLCKKNTITNIINIVPTQIKIIANGEILLSLGEGGGK